MYRVLIAALIFSFPCIAVADDDFVRIFKNRNVAHVADDRVNGGAMGTDMTGDLNKSSGKKTTVTRDKRYPLGFETNKLRGNAAFGFGIGSGTYFLAEPRPGSILVANSTTFHFNTELGYELLVKTSKVNVYTALNFGYDLLVNGSTSFLSDSLLSIGSLSILSVKMKAGVSILQDSLLLYATFGLGGLLPSDVSITESGSHAVHTESFSAGFAPIFGLGVSHDIIPRRLALVIEIEGTPIIHSSLSTALPGLDPDSPSPRIDGMILVRGGVRVTF